MKVLHISDTESLSGAGIAALRIHRALLDLGADSRIAVARSPSSATDVEPLLGPAGRVLHSSRRIAVKLLLLALGADPGETLSANLVPTGVQRRINARDEDLVHLHWIGLELLRIEEIAKIKRPLVWTLHDEWFSLGLEHYAQDPGALLPRRGAAFRRLDRNVRLRKAVCGREAEPEIVCPSRWLAERTLAAGMADAGRVHVVPNAVPISVFKPSSRRSARERLGLPPDRPVIGTGALSALDDPRKGHVHLVEALSRLARRASGPLPTLLVFGASGCVGEMPVATHNAGTVTSDVELAQLYAAMDVFVCPSRQENLPNTIAEAMACGVPCVAFEVGGIPDLIQHDVNGHLARPYSVEDLAEGIVHCLDPERSQAMGIKARMFAETYLSPNRVARQYVEIYRQALLRGRTGDFR